MPGQDRPTSISLTDLTAEDDSEGAHDPTGDFAPRRKVADDYTVRARALAGAAGDEDTVRGKDC